MRSWMIAGSLGMVIPVFLPWLPAPWILTVAGLVAMALLYSRRFRSVGILLGFAALSAGWAHDSLQGRLPETRSGQDLEACGHVVGLAAVRPRLARFRFQLEPAAGATGDGPEIQLSSYQPLDLYPGRYLCLQMRLRAPRGLANPGTFDYERWLLQHGIQATGYVRAVLGADPLRDRRSFISSARGAVRDALQQALDQTGPVPAVLLALTVGERSQLDAETREVFLRTGTAHLMAISGLHLTLVAGFFYWPVARMIRWLYLGERLPAPRIAGLAGLLAGIGYGILSGWGLPVQRASIMLCCALVPILLGWRPPMRDVLLLAVFLVLLGDPLAVCDGGFWLSFGAVGVLVYVLAGRPVRPGGVSQQVRTQVALSLALLPVLAGVGLPLTFTSIPANLFAVPWTGLLVLPVTLVGTAIECLFGCGDRLLQAAAALMDLQLTVLRAMAGIGHPWTPRNPGPAALLLALLGTLWVLAPAGFPARWAGVLLLLPMAFPYPVSLGAGDFETHVLDVGQGLSVLVRTRDHTMIYDAGQGGGEQLDMGRAVVVPYLRSLGVGRLSLAVISHGDADHAGGMPAVLRSVPTEMVLAGEPPAPNVQRVAIPCRAGQQWVWNGVQFRVLGPRPGHVPRRRNNTSCVLHVAGKGGSVLLPGDIERKAEHALIRHNGERLGARILIAPHHGSRTSSSPAFVRAVAPDLVVFSAGWRSRFGHPHPDIVARYQRKGIEPLDTGASGRIRIRVLASGELQMTPGRVQWRRWWRSGIPPADAGMGVVEYRRSRYWHGYHFREGS